MTCAKLTTTATMDAAGTIEDLVELIDALTPSQASVVEKLTLRVMCESSHQPLYVQILDEVLADIRIGG